MIFQRFSRFMKTSNYDVFRADEKLYDQLYPGLRWAWYPDKDFEPPLGYWVLMRGNKIFRTTTSL